MGIIRSADICDIPVPVLNQVFGCHECTFDIVDLDLQDVFMLQVTVQYDDREAFPDGFQDGFI